MTAIMSEHDYQDYRIDTIRRKILSDSIPGNRKSINTTQTSIYQDYQLYPGNP